MSSRAAKKAAFLAKIKAKRAARAASSLDDGTSHRAAGVSAFLPDDLRKSSGAYSGIDEFIAQLPSNYQFEVKKSVWRITSEKAKCVALQMPEGLLMYSFILADIFETYCDDVSVIVMGDVTYGACCIDDITAKLLHCDLLIHYAHSCLVSVASCSIPIQYVFVSISFDVSHLVETVKLNFAPGTRLALVGTIQFASAFHVAHSRLIETFPEIFVPQASPLSPGELLGCTSPMLPHDTQALVYVADGYFHLESIMISNPNVPAYRYCPHSKKFTKHKYDQKEMLKVRHQAIQTARQTSGKVGLILGTLGRQGNTALLSRLRSAIEQSGRVVMVMLMSEIFPAKLQVRHPMLEYDVWVQVACPRLSIDWGYAFDAPLLNAYEAEVAFGNTDWKKVYPMDYYSKDGGKWTNYYKEENSKTPPFPMNLAGCYCRVTKGRDIDSFDMLSSPHKRLSWVFAGQDLIESGVALGEQLFEFLGMHPDWVSSLKQRGYHFKLCFWKPSVRDSPVRATWDGLFQLIQLAYPQVWPKIEPFRLPLVSTSLTTIEEAAGYNFLDVAKIGADDPRFITLAKLIQPSTEASLCHARSFLYFELGVKELFRGDGFTYSADGTRGTAEYLTRNSRVDSLDSCRLIEI